ncbi:MAG: FAD-binding protein, partial [Methanomicrobiales archaeon]|nr:FAD-binding protein [Methanomicrobiales archaeon]
VQPGQHYSMGGIDVDLGGRSGLPGLYAAGECACVSVHGANRLGGNSLLETVVFGRLAADSIIMDAPQGKEPAGGPIRAAMEESEGGIREILGRSGGEPGGRKPEGEPTGRSPGGESTFALIRGLEETMFHHFGIFREGKDMEEGLRRIRELQERFPKAGPKNTDPAVNQALVRYLELGGMLRLAEVVALGALAREESRGSHTRRDYTGRDDGRFLAHTMATMEKGKVTIGYRPVSLGMFDVEERGY